ncbi:MAG: hypothetical protein WHV63_02700 [Ignavibacteria bacterium]|jgi:hypothetical protein|nr:hypothetical protein [Ignavibacteria bacterium]MDH7528595.1 hypothetical protein [Ignavibacteria bacterium]
MDFIELQIADDIQKLKELDTYTIKLIKIIYNPKLHSPKELEEFQHFIEKSFPKIPITFEENLEAKKISFALGIE